MNSLAPKNYEDALKKARSKPSKPRKPMNRTASLSKRSHKSSARKRGVKKAQKKSVSTLKRAAWTQFSIWVRTRGADSNGMNTCVTCGTRKHWKELQAGHFIAGRNNAVLFCERGCNPQCYSCNVGKHGNTVAYYKWMLKEFSQDVIDELILESNQTRKWLAGELVEIAAHYKKLNDTNSLTKK